MEGVLTQWELVFLGQIKTRSFSKSVSRQDRLNYCFTWMRCSNFWLQPQETPLMSKNTLGITLFPQTIFGSELQSPSISLHLQQQRDATNWLRKHNLRWRYYRLKSPGGLNIRDPVPTHGCKPQPQILRWEETRASITSRPYATKWHSEPTCRRNSPDRDNHMWRACGHSLSMISFVSRRLLLTATPGADRKSIPDPSRPRMTSVWTLWGETARW